VFAPPATPLICLDPGHGTPPAIGRQTEPIGPGSKVLKIKDGGGAPGEASVALAIGLRTRTLLRRAGYRVAMTRTRPTTTLGNIARAQFCNVRHAALMIRIHADGSPDSASHGLKTLYPALHRG
jgi:N-acetylmuramoyl-L-alanine amidase